ncbi:sialate O-acetylesterase [Clostridium aminobutyricum]|uniref:Sialate O-acetylesterase domain-containing protein n=1 Tax=Clostridium aminobutyricum TaxID=33953 RepID=A0A939D661_CLOAM|nr:sialate O-acetylesterase [Clostridium aminobutyricum]MBN7771932.1 hypothetical protein [Clostridium aminobutyricum]
MKNIKSRRILNLIGFLVVAAGVMGGIALYTGSNSYANEINRLISLDDSSYKIEVDAGEHLIVKLPDGRPRIPQISCENGSVFQAYFTDGYKQAIARIYVKDDLYQIKFVKDPELGFELQYDDRYKFIPKTIVAKRFSSSNPDIAAVDNLGNVKIVGVSDEGAVITATDGAKSEELVITKTIRAPLEIYIITGQSNASYYYAEPQLATATKPGTAYHYSELVGGEQIRSMNNKDGSMARGNIEAALGKTLYELTGEKLLMVNAGVSGRKVDTFIPKTGESYQHIEYVWGVIQKHLHEEEFLKHFEPRIRSYIWVQGESDGNTDVNSYKENYMLMHQTLTGDGYGFQNGFIILTKPKFAGSYNAQLQLADENSDIAIATRSAGSFTVENGKMRFDDLHYSQVGDNLLGEETAKSIFKAYTEGIDSVTGDY